MEYVRGRLSVPVAFLLSAILLAASPEPRAAEEGDCGANEGNLCWENESCLWLLFYRQCTTKYRYYPKENPEHGGFDGFDGNPLKPWPTAV